MKYHIEVKSVGICRYEWAVTSDNGFIQEYGNSWLPCLAKKDAKKCVKRMMNKDKPFIIEENCGRGK